VGGYEFGTDTPTSSQTDSDNAGLAGMWRRCSQKLRLSVMHNRTDSITSMVPSALNSGSAKALFYVFHILPEWLCIVILFAFNMREVCGTGPFGDYRDADESEVQREERRKKEAEKRMKRQPISGP